MTTADALQDDRRPRFAPHVRMTFDARRGRWVVQAPERLLMPDEIATEVLQRCDGRSIKEIIDGLVQAFDAPREEIAKDVVVLIGNLQRRGILVS
jgi:pyrroloquinoline quinone biosynthesis protein D